MDNKKVRRILGGIVALAMLIGLCGITGATMFWLGRTTASEETAEMLGPTQETEELLEEAEATAPVLPDEPVGETTAEGPEAEALEAEAFEEATAEGPDAEPPETEPTEEAAGTPAVEELGEEEVLPGLERDVGFTEEDLETMWEAWAIIEDQYDGELPTDEELSYAVIRGMLETLDDDFTSFANPDVAERAREMLDGTFEGIGAIVQENEEGLTQIVRPFDGQPADVAGLEEGDVVIAVDDESVVDLTLQEVVALIRGPRGTEVTLTVERDGVEEPLEFTITRDRIEIPVLEAEMLDEDIAYVRLSTFSRNADSQLRDALAELLAEDPQGLILDLRDNGGGFLDQSVAVADAFLPEGVVLYERSRTLGIEEVFRSDTGDLAESVPMVVLVNAGSASASEIVAGAIRDNDRGVLIGETTFGKGSVQNSHALSDGSELRVTIARWYIPSNQSIDGTGITPDIEVETPEDLGGEDDTQLQRAIEYLLENGDEG